jgi:hypothetical protein
MDGNRTVGAGSGTHRPRLFGLGAWNVALLATGVVAVLFGYVLLSRGSVTLAPLLLVAGYVVLIPVGLLLGSRSPVQGPDERRNGGE